MNKIILNEISSAISCSHKSCNYAAIDFDNTCIINDLGEAVLAFLCENSLLKKLDGETAFKRYYHLLDTKQTQTAYEFAAKILDGFSADEVKEVVKATVAAERKIIGKRRLFGREINKGLKTRESVREIIDYLYKNKCDLWIISSSASVIVEEAVKIFLPKYKIKAIGMENKIEHEKLTDNLIPPTPSFQGKVKNIQKYISSEIKPIIAMGDSMNDRYMLEYAKIKIVVSRNNELTSLAKKNNWLILQS